MKKLFFITLILLASISNAYADMHIAFINKSDTDRMQFYYKICKFDGSDKCVEGPDPTGVISPKSVYFQRIDMRPGENKGLIVERVIISTPLGETYVKKFKNNDGSKLNPCESQTESSALLFEITGKTNIVTCASTGFSSEE